MRYLLLTFLRKPNGQIDELVQVGKKIKNSDLSTCNVILDYAENLVVKCVIEGKKLDTDWDKMNSYYSKIYPNLVEQLQKEAKITKTEK